MAERGGRGQEAEGDQERSGGEGAGQGGEEAKGGKGRGGDGGKRGDGVSFWAIFWKLLEALSNFEPILRRLDAAFVSGFLPSFLSLCHRRMYLVLLFSLSPLALLVTLSRSFSCSLSPSILFLSLTPLSPPVPPYPFHSFLL